MYFCLYFHQTWAFWGLFWGCDHVNHFWGLFWGCDHVNHFWESIYVFCLFLKYSSILLFRCFHGGWVILGYVRPRSYSSKLPGG